MTADIKRKHKMGRAGENERESQKTHSFLWARSGSRFSLLRCPQSQSAQVDRMGAKPVRLKCGDGSGGAGGSD